MRLGRYRAHCPREGCNAQVQATRVNETYFSVEIDGLLYAQENLGDEDDGSVVVEWRYYCADDHELEEEEVRL